MRDIAKEANMALGAVYHYFPSKASIVLAYYWSTQAAHVAAFEEGAAQAGDLRSQLTLLIRSRLDVVGKDRKFLPALAQLAIDPANPLSVFSNQSSELRRQSIALCAQALRQAGLSDELVELFAPVVWAGLLGFLLLYVFDRSPKQRLTFQILEETIDVAIPFFYASAMPELAPLRERIGDLFQRVGLVAFLQSKET